MSCPLECSHTTDCCTPWCTAPGVDGGTVQAFSGHSGQSGTRLWEILRAELSDLLENIYLVN